MTLMHSNNKSWYKINPKISRSANTLIWKTIPHEWSGVIDLQSVCAHTRDDYLRRYRKLESHDADQLALYPMAHPVFHKPSCYLPQLKSFLQVSRSNQQQWHEDLRILCSHAPFSRHKHHKLHSSMDITHQSFPSTFVLLKVRRSSSQQVVP